MIIIEKNSGAKIPYEVNGSKICFDDDLTINLAKREEDYAVHIDVCYDADRQLCIGAAAGRSYVAEIDIPARKYTDPVPVQSEDGDNEGMMRNTTPCVPLPFNMDLVTLSLWAVE